MKSYVPIPQVPMNGSYRLPESYIPMSYNPSPKNYFYSLPDPALLMASQPPRQLVGYRSQTYQEQIQSSALAPQRSQEFLKKTWEKPDNREQEEDLVEKFAQMKVSSFQCKVLPFMKDPRSTARVNRGTISDRLKLAKFFILKSYTKENIDKAIECGYWASTSKGNRILTEAFISAKGEYPVILFFSVNGSTNFYGVAEMKSEVDENLTLSDWKEKWRGLFRLEWLFLKEIPNRNFKNIKNSLNSYRVFPSSRNGQEVPFEEGIMALRIFEQYEGQYPYETL